jgi:hypothetical protein
MRWTTCLLLFAVGCSSNVDLTGMYQVSSEMLDPTGCGPGMAVTPPPPYVQISNQNFLGVTLVTLSTCTSSDPSTCSQAGLLEEPIDNGWKGETSVSSGGGTSPCALTYILSTATLDGSTLTFEGSTYGDSVTLDTASCTPKEATNRGTSMPCKNYMQITATKL